MDVRERSTSDMHGAGCWQLGWQRACQPESEPGGQGLFSAPPLSTDANCERAPPALFPLLPLACLPYLAEALQGRSPSLSGVPDTGVETQSCWVLHCSTLSECFSLPLRLTKDWWHPLYYLAAAPAPDEEQALPYPYFGSSLTCHHSASHPAFPNQCSPSLSPLVCWCWMILWFSAHFCSTVGSICSWSISAHCSQHLSSPHPQSSYR